MKSLVKMSAAALALIASGYSVAGPAEYVFTPTVEKGEREIDFKFGTRKNSGGERTSAASLGLGYGVNDWWFTEVYGKYKHETAEGTYFDAIEWENKFQLTETGKYPVDIGFITEIERPKDRSEGYEFKFGPLFQTEFGKTQLNLNILFERNYQSDESNPMRMGYQWQTKYRYHPQFEFGLQGFGEMGKWNDWAKRADQEHRLGPAIFGKLPLGERQAIKYNAAVLVDANDAVHNTTFRTQIEYEF